MASYGYEALDKSAELFKALENIPDKEKEIRLTAAIDKVASEKHWDDFVNMYFRIYYTRGQKCIPKAVSIAGHSPQILFFK